MRKLPPLLKSFTIYSLIAFLATGSALVFFINNHIKNVQLDSIKQVTHLTLHYIVEPELNTVDINKSLSISKVNELNNKIERLFDEGTIMGINIYNKNGALFYSSNMNKLVKSESNNIDLKKFLTDLSNDNTNNLNTIGTYSIENNIVKEYVPIVRNNSLWGVYEVFEPYSDIEKHIKDMTLIITLIVFLGLLILYILLLKIIYNSSKTLIYQNNSLLKSKNALENAYSKLNESYRDTIFSLSNAIDARDSYTAGHSDRVAKISLEIGKAMKLTEKELEVLKLAALFHDIGKIGIPDEILHKPSGLTEKEYEKIKEHPQIGVNILKNIDFFSDIIPLILYHHEKFFGNGYPLGLTAGSIPIGARIITVADSYDAMTSNRAYRQGVSHKKAIDELIKYQNIQFDKNVVEAFLKTNFCKN